MINNMVLDRTIQQWMDKYPLFQHLMQLEETLWINPNYTNFLEGMKSVSLTTDHVKDAEARLARFAPYIAQVFPETQPQKGIIESPVKAIPQMKSALEKQYDFSLPGNLVVKCDSHLAISGSIKARGGIYEVLKHAEDLAIEHGKLTIEQCYTKLNTDEMRDFFSQYSVVVGSTGNLGLSIGIMSAKLGFHVTVHMSADAKQWKKDLLRSKGVEVIEYESDYSKAVEEGRKQAEADSNSYFVDDENSVNLFLGYAVAASRLQHQLTELGITVDAEHPLFVYLPCGVGGGPGGVAFGLKLLYQDNVHFFFAEPTHSPCMLIGCMTEKHDQLSVQDFGIDNITAADGLAVGRPSGFVGKTLSGLLSGVYTVDDNHLYRLLAQLADEENLYLEPSALAGMPGIINTLHTQAGQDYLAKQGLEDKKEQITHLVWATGGSMVPQEEMNKYYSKGQRLMDNA